MAKLTNVPPKGMNRYIRYKWVDANMGGFFSSFIWPRPSKNKPSKWAPRITGKLQMCCNGYHTPMHTENSIYNWRPSRYAVLLKLEVADEAALRERTPTKRVWRYARVLKIIGPQTLQQIKAIFVKEARNVKNK